MWHITEGFPSIVMHEFSCMRFYMHASTYGIYIYLCVFSFLYITFHCVAVVVPLCIHSGFFLHISGTQKNQKNVKRQKKGMAKGNRTKVNPSTQTVWEEWMHINFHHLSSSLHVRAFFSKMCRAWICVHSVGSIHESRFSRGIKKPYSRAQTTFFYCLFLFLANISNTWFFATDEGNFSVSMLSFVFILVFFSQIF